VSSQSGSGSHQQAHVHLLTEIHRAPVYSKALLESGALADDVEWWAAGPAALLPWAGTVRGPAALAEWFTRLAAAMAYEGFSAVEYIAQEDQVAVVIRSHGRARESRRPFASEIVRIYTFRGGKIARVRNFYDTTSYVAALHGVDQDAPT